MYKRTIFAHPSVAVAYSPSGKLLMAVYDGGYPQVSYRFSANNIGGNPKEQEKDKGPKQVLHRETDEEFDPEQRGLTKFAERVLWAPKQGIQLIRDSIKNAEPYQDFLSIKKQLPDDPTTLEYIALISAFKVEIPESVIEFVQDSLRRCRRLSYEGLTGVFTLDELTNDPVKGNLSTAHEAAPIINHLFKSHIPFPSQLEVIAVGDVRPTYADYITDYQPGELAWKL